MHYRVSWGDFAIDKATSIDHPAIQREIRAMARQTIARRWLAIALYGVLGAIIVGSAVTFVWPVELGLMAPDRQPLVSAQFETDLRSTPTTTSGVQETDLLSLRADGRGVLELRGDERETAHLVYALGSGETPEPIRRALLMSLFVAITLGTFLTARGRVRGVIGVKHLCAYPPLWIACIFGYSLLLVAAALLVHSQTGVYTTPTTILLSVWGILTASLHAGWCVPAAFLVGCGLARIFTTPTTAPAQSSPEIQTQGVDICLWPRQEKTYSELLDNWVSKEEGPIGDADDALFARSQEVEHLYNAIRGSRGTILLTGPRGSGKTSLYYAAAHRLVGESFLCTRISAWELADTARVVEEMLQAIITEIGREVPIAPLRPIPARYAVMFKTAESFWQRFVGALIHADFDQQRALRDIDGILAAIGLRVVLLVDDLERWREQRDHKSANRSPEQPLAIGSLVFNLRQIRQITLVLADSDPIASDESKIVRTRLAVPELTLREWLACVQLFVSNELNRYDDPPVWRPPDNYDGHDLVYDHRPFERDDGPFRFLDSLLALPSLASALHRLSRTPRTLRAVLAEVRRRWTVLHGTVALEHLIAIEVIFQCPENLGLFRRASDILDPDVVNGVLRKRRGSNASARRSESNGATETETTASDSPPSPRENPTSSAAWLLKAEPERLNTDLRALRKIVDFLFPSSEHQEHPQSLYHESPIDCLARILRPPVRDDDPSLEKERRAAKLWQDLREMLIDTRPTTSESDRIASVIEELEADPAFARLWGRFRSAATHKERRIIFDELLSGLLNWFRDDVERTKRALDAMHHGWRLFASTILWEIGTATAQGALRSDARLSLLLKHLPQWSAWNLSMSFVLLRALTLRYDDDPALLRDAYDAWTEHIRAAVDGEASELVELLVPATPYALHWFVRRHWADRGDQSNIVLQKWPELPCIIGALLDDCKEPERGVLWQQIANLITLESPPDWKIETDPETEERRERSVRERRIDMDFVREFFGVDTERLLSALADIDIALLPEDDQEQAEQLVEQIRKALADIENERQQPPDPS